MADGAFFANQKKISPTPQCEAVYGVQAGDTCSGITQMFKLATKLFSDLNPNLVCDKLFVGQWVCTDGEFSS
ncbi:hypothetical protein AQUCO_04700023v1 [Aquilegia coerulea]|uniref:LysM domain-containing protein n=1 Tax=Aquilegia coerulea TaxID=218851 RepID=A0A2G5CKS3_AQUCA|nr:hypothetical protein AQUCO_04700023v1 [Aquilegia coerulea]